MDSERLSVSLRRVPEKQAHELLEDVLEVSGFWSMLADTLSSSKVAIEQFQIAIKPDMDVYNLALPSGTEPALVNHLALLLHERGYRSIIVIDARNSRDHWLLNRDPLMVADLIGYDFSEKLYTLRGNDEALSASDIWSQSHFRINFAKNRTHESQAYALCVHNLVGVSAREDMHDELGTRCLNLLRKSPPHFNLIDAYISCHGPAGERAPKMLKTCTMLASSDALLIDLIGASKMGLDPYSSEINAKCLKAQGLPSNYQIDGDLEHYSRWQNVHPMLIDSALKRNSADELGIVSAGWFQTVDRENFPFREFYNDRINAFIAPLLDRIGEDSRAQWTVVLLNYAIGQIGKAILAQHTLFAKGKLKRQVRSLETNLDDYKPDDYTRLPDYLLPNEQLVHSAKLIGGNVRLCRLDDASMFFGHYEFPIEYDDFVSRVNIEQAIQYMNDYIGGSVVSVETDNKGRVVRQAERNLYLQQPNWMALVGGNMIDVEKLEFIEYRDDRRSIFWRTVASPNNSADCDDGRVSFIRADNGCTLLEIFTRQKFTLPQIFEVGHIDLFPSIRDPIIEGGYQNFFDSTIANLQSKYDGNEFRVGKDQQPINVLSGSGLGDVGRYFATALATLSELLRHDTQLPGLGDWFSARSWADAPSSASAEDEDGFRHFGPTSIGTRYDLSANQAGNFYTQFESAIEDAPNLLAGLATAIQRDFEDFADRNTGDS